MPASVALAVVVNALEAVGEHVAQHLVLAPGWVVLRFVLWRPASRVRYHSFEAAVAGAAVWVAAVVVGLAVLGAGRPG